MVSWKRKSIVQLLLPSVVYGNNCAFWLPYIIYLNTLFTKINNIKLLLYFSKSFHVSVLVLFWIRYFLIKTVVSCFIQGWLFSLNILLNLVSFNSATVQFNNFIHRDRLQTCWENFFLHSHKGGNRKYFANMCLWKKKFCLLTPVRSKTFATESPFSHWFWQLSSSPRQCALRIWWSSKWSAMFPIFTN